MSRADLNLLYALEVLLSEASVAGAARRLKLSPSAMSRTLARLRETTGDPLLVRAGRRLVFSPRALELRDRVGQLVRDAERVLRPAVEINLGRLNRTFTLRASEGFVENFGAPLLERLGREAPGVLLRFIHKLEKDSGPLREGAVDLETGVIDKRIGPEVRAQGLFQDRYVGVVRKKHALAPKAVAVAQYVAARHVQVQRRDADHSAVDVALVRMGLERRIATTVGGFSAALALARASNVIATVPERHTGNLRDGMHTFDLPFAVPEFTVSLLWHPRMDGDPAHRWLRGCVRAVCGA